MNGAPMLDVRRLRLLREVKVRGTFAEVAAALNLQPVVRIPAAGAAGERGRGGTAAQGRPPRPAHPAGRDPGRPHRVAAVPAGTGRNRSGRVPDHGHRNACGWRSSSPPRWRCCPMRSPVCRSGYPEVRIEMVQREPETALYETWARDFDLVIAEQYPGHAAPRHPELDRRALTTDAIRLAVPSAGLPGGERPVPRGCRRPALGDGTARGSVPALGRAGVPARPALSRMSATKPPTCRPTSG